MGWGPDPRTGGPRGPRKKAGFQTAREGAPAGAAQRPDLGARNFLWLLPPHPPHPRSVLLFQREQADPARDPAIPLPGAPLREQGGSRSLHTQVHSRQQLETTVPTDR